MKNTVNKDDSLSRSFMCLGFASAVLIVAVQWGNTPTDSMIAATESFSSTLAEGSPIMTLEGSGVAKLRERAARRNTARSGLTAALETVTRPLILPYQTTLVIDLSDRQVHLYQEGVVTANYSIAVGKAGWETPTGDYKIINMQTDPIWQHPFTGEVVPPGADNPLGSRWIGFWTDGQHQLGLHGTNQEDLIGQAVSHGCIRMREIDIQALYSQVVEGMPVVVQP